MFSCRLPSYTMDKYLEMGLVLFGSGALVILLCSCLLFCSPFLSQSTSSFFFFFIFFLFLKVSCVGLVELQQLVDIFSLRTALSCSGVNKSTTPRRPSCVYVFYVFAGIPSVIPIPGKKHKLNMFIKQWGFGGCFWVKANANPVFVFSVHFTIIRFVQFDLDPKNSHFGFNLPARVPSG